MTTIIATICGSCDMEVKLLPKYVTLHVRSDEDDLVGTGSTYGFLCPHCFSYSATLLDMHIANLLCQSGVAIDVGKALDHLA